MGECGKGAQGERRKLPFYSCGCGNGRESERGNLEREKELERGRELRRARVRELRESKREGGNWE